MMQGTTDHKSKGWNMRISTKGRYALEAMLFMSLNAGKQPVSIKEIADTTEISESYLEQLFIQLKKAKIIKGYRGVLGGYVLAFPANVIMVGEVLRAVEGSLEPVRCIDKGTKCDRFDTCATQVLWTELADAISNVVDQKTLADLAEDYRQMEKILFFAI